MMAEEGGTHKVSQVKDGWAGNKRWGSRCAVGWGSLSLLNGRQGAPLACAQHDIEGIRVADSKSKEDAASAVSCAPTTD